MENKKLSPKGIFRTGGLFVLGAVLMATVALLDTTFFSGWGLQTLIQFAKVLIANSVLYGVCRIVLHDRTHELTGRGKLDRQNVLILAHAFVTGCALAI